MVFTLNLHSQILDVESTSDGILIPRMTEAQRDAISPDIEGMLIYQTNNTKGFYYYNGSVWTPLSGGGGGGGATPIILGGKIFGNFNSGPRYTIGTAACVAASELQCTMIVPRGGTLKNMYVLPSAVSAGSATFTVRVDGVNKLLTATVPNASSAVVSDLVNTVIVSQGQKLTVEMNVPGGANPGVSYFISMLFE